ncbi:MAG: sulfatase [Nitrospirae bacterium]|nr:sulfatase [Nitrospirota bacterium]
MMTNKKSFLLILRFVFAVFSLYFLRDSFYYWDGYSYYMRFIELVPDLSLVYIIYTLCAVLITILIGICIYLLALILRSFTSVRIEHIILYFFLSFSLIVLKRIFFADISVSDIFGGYHFVSLIAAGAMLFSLVFIMRSKCKNIVLSLDGFLTPLVWIFSIVFILSFPISFYGKRDVGILQKSESNIEDKKTASSASGKRPNIIFVVMDTLTSLDMELYGYELPTTPFINEWAKSSYVFNKVYAAADWTTPTVTSLMTSQRPWTHRVWYQVQNKPVYRSENNLLRSLKDNGYNIYGFIQNRSAHPNYLGMTYLFSVCDDYFTFWDTREWWFNMLEQLVIGRPIVHSWFFVENNLISRQLKAAPKDLETTLFRSERVYDRFLEFVSEADKQSKMNGKSQGNESNSNQPFFAWLHVLPPHDPYLPPEPYKGIFVDTKVIKQKSISVGNYEPEDQPFVDILKKQYDENILYSDQQFKIFLSRLSEIMDMSNTIVVLTSDHGESFAHGFYGHGPHGAYLYEQLLRVPLIINIPGHLENKVINTPVEQIDIAPTILELADIPVPQWMEGRSLVPLFSDGYLEKRPIFSMALIKNKLFGNPISKGAVSVLDGDYKLIFYLENGKKLLFNLHDDPEEVNDLAEKEPEIAGRLKLLIEVALSGANKRITEAQ